MYRFMQDVNHTYGTNFIDYDDLYQWSVDNIAAFWAEMWRFAGIKASKTYETVIDDPTRMPGAQWFTGSRLNFAENLLRYRDDRPALVFRGEDRIRRTLTYAELYRATARAARALKGAGIRPGDRVVGFMPNMPETSSPCSPPSASGRSGPPARPISASRASSTASVRSSRRSSSPPTAISSRARPLTHLARIAGHRQGDPVDREGGRRALYPEEADLGDQRSAECRPLP